jgi:hypothetical protein
MADLDFDVSVRVKPETWTIAIAVRAEHLDAARAALGFPTAASSWHDNEAGWRVLIVNLKKDQIYAVTMEIVDRLLTTTPSEHVDAEAVEQAVAQAKTETMN